MLELAGAVAPGQRTTDGRSIVPLLRSSGPPPAGWRNGLLVEHLGENNQWMSICGWVFNASGCEPPPRPGKDPSFLIDGPQNTWAQWRVVNATHDFSYTEFRDAAQPPSASATNVRAREKGADRCCHFFTSAAFFYAPRAFFFFARRRHFYRSGRSFTTRARTPGRATTRPAAMRPPTPASSGPWPRARWTLALEKVNRTNTNSVSIFFFFMKQISPHQRQ